MKKFLKVLAAAAAVAAVVPFHGEGDENGGTLKALLWKATWKLDPDYQSDPDITVTFGFNNPFTKECAEDHLFADELVVDYCCDNSLVHDCGNIPDYPCGECECETECESGDVCSCCDSETPCDCGYTE